MIRNLVITKHNWCFIIIERQIIANANETVSYLAPYEHGAKHNL